ncbi:peptidyl-tRNA hydrolase [Patellaria atrata CBS 101060]|uniref:peptidyl-tRNA hydrolase n=1 Tax=Patellaria atrata CBS 101060 TaxID=1346257 RepID=A0A9P4SH58_9PEZI|nr:peptidyl-tRNA hydrolase [Patellaria atrata CBS 101060]
MSKDHQGLEKVRASKFQYQEHHPLVPPPSDSEPVSRRQRRKGKRSPSPLLIPQSSENPNLSNSAHPLSPVQYLQVLTHDALSIPSSLPLTIMPPTSSIPLLIASIGNPGPAYADTLHSAGHTALDALRVLLNYPSFSKSRALGSLVSLPPSPDLPWTLYQSPTLMNVSGPAISSVWRAWPYSGVGAGGVLVIVHDELEKGLGSVNVKRSGSPRGHNGLKSIIKSLPGVDFVRVGVGIGRPESREPGVVSNYVLSKMNGRERKVVEDSAWGILKALQEIRG